MSTKPDASGPDSPPCTAKTNPSWPHRYEQNTQVAADPAITPGHDTCGRAQTGHAQFTPEVIRHAEWGEARYQRAAENAVRHGTPLNLAHAEQELIGEAHAEALKEEFGEDYYTEADWLDNIDAALDDAAGLRAAIAETRDPARIAALTAEAASLDQSAAYAEDKLADLRQYSRHAGDSDEF